MNKKGNIYIVLLFFAMLFLLLFLGVLMAFGSMIINWTFDEAIPELSNLGMIENVNMTEASDYTLTPLNTLVQNFTWITGVLYVMFLITLFGIVVAFKMNPSRWLIALYFLLTIMLIFGCIFMSNIYEEFYTGTDEIATRLQEHVILSNFILYSPSIFTVLTLLMGIVLFSGIQEEYI